jgi:hypothetical protein
MPWDYFLTDQVLKLGIGDLKRGIKLEISVVLSLALPSSANNVFETTRKIGFRYRPQVTVRPGYFTKFLRKILEQMLTTLSVEAADDLNK